MKLTALYKYAFCALLALVGAMPARAFMGDDFLPMVKEWYDVEMLPSVEVIPGALVRQEWRFTAKKDDTEETKRLSIARKHPSYTVIRFKTLNGRHCTIQVNEEKSSFKGCKLANWWTICYGKGKWSGDSIGDIPESLVISVVSTGAFGEPYNYELSYKLMWDVIHYP